MKTLFRSKRFLLADQLNWIIGVDDPVWQYGRAVSFGWRRFNLGLFWIHTVPAPGEALTHGHHYRGFWLRIMFWLPFQLERS